MSANIYYRFSKPPEGDLGVSAPSSFLDAMRRAFHTDGPWHLDGKALPKLEGMAAMHGDHDNPFQKMIELIRGEDFDKSTEIEVWAEY